ncbi:MAG: hypothetical protein HFI21_00050 [Lachnospiraceae bacterium]|nr:hypothetical protein [Lachnospiraceae bacterium]MCI9477378.1 hypothetical protein [Lachnospiraceae bacterium]
MTTLLELREKIKIFMGKYDIYIIPLMKFLLALIAFTMINGSVGFMEKAKNPAISLILALMCSFLPVNLIAVFGGILVLAHAYALSLEFFVIAFVVILLMVLLFFRTAPQYGYLLILTPMAFVLKVPYVVPLAMGLVGTPAAAVPVACGTVAYYLLHYMKLNTTMLSEAETESMKQKITYLIDNVIRNKEMMLMAAAFALTLLIVYVVRRMSIDYSWSIAIGTGAVAEFVVLLLGSMVMGVPLKVVPVLLGSVVSAALAILLQLTVFSMDYSRTEYVQFEDDEYYYYVKAVPKVTIAVPDKQVKRISSQKKQSTARRKAAQARRPSEHGHTEARERLHTERARR